MKSCWRLPDASRVCGLQFHLTELDRPNKLNDMLPGLGRDWTETLMGSQAIVFHCLGAHVMEWEAVAARWARDDHALLQPATPCWIMPAIFCIAAMKSKTAKKELELYAVPAIL